MLKRALLAALAVLAGAHTSSADRFDEAVVRARALCARMTLEEKAGELMVYDYNCMGSDRWGVYTNYVNGGKIGALMRVLSVEKTRKLQEYKMTHSRLGIPLIIHEDITHGWKTTLPLQLALACSWDDEAVERAESVAARESAAIGIQMTYSPQVEVSDDPRWGRIGGTHGEDPYLSGRIAAARVRGDQGRTLEELADGEHVIACVKHFIGYSSLQGGKDYRHRDFSRRELLETHLPPHKAAIDAGALAVMNAYTVFEGVPCNFSEYLLKDLLRKQLGFRGQVVTDWTTLTFSIDEGAATDIDDAAVRGLRAGVDMDMISGAFLRLPALVRDGKVAEKDLDTAVIRSLALKYLMGLFDNPYRFCDAAKAKRVLFSERNREDVLPVTRESIVLLKNEGGILPLDVAKPVALTGTWADDGFALTGGMFKDVGTDVEGYGDGTDARMLTLRGAMERRWGANLRYKALDRASLARGIGGLPEGDVVVLAIGEPPGFTGERKGRATLEIPDSELENLRLLKRAGRRIVSVVFAGRPFLMNEIVWLSDAVVLAWQPGAMGGVALAEILSGVTNPSGKLAQHIPQHVGQIPISYREKRTFIPCSYSDIPATPLFPFGFGLSYTTFAYSKPTVGRTAFAVGDPVGVSVDVTNTGRVAGREVVQLYVRDEVASVLPRERELKEFASVWLEPGETKRVSFEVPSEAFALYDADLRHVVESGFFTVFVGPDSTTTNGVRVLIREGNVRCE